MLAEGRMSDAKDIACEDRRARRCPMLGHDVHFGYCRAPGRELPCGKVFDCWWELFDVEAFVRAHYSQEDIARVLGPRQDKVATLVDLIRKAQARTGKGP